MSVVWFQKFTIQRKIKYTVLLFLLILFSLSFVWFVLSREKRAIEWSPSTVLKINSGESWIFVDPQDAYHHVTLNENKLVSPEIITHNARDCIIDDDKILVVYMNSNSPSELVFKVITKGNVQRRIVLKTFSDKRIKVDPYPEIYRTDKAYYVWSDLYLYKISKGDFKIEQIQLERKETPLITRDDRLFLRRGEFLTLVQTYSNDTKILRLDPNSGISGWGLEEKTVVINKRDVAEMISLKDETKTKLRTPSYGNLRVIGNIGHLAIIQFYPDGGKLPLFEPALCVYSLIDDVDYWFYQSYLYDVENDTFYDIPDEIKKLYPSKHIFLTGYCAPINLRLIETEFCQYVDN